MASKNMSEEESEPCLASDAAKERHGCLLGIKNEGSKIAQDSYASARGSS